MDVYISGVGMTKFGRSKESLEKMMAEAGFLTLKEAQLERVDAIYLGVMNVEEFVGDSNFAAVLANTPEKIGTHTIFPLTPPSPPLPAPPSVN